jgi:hypothetical protein
MEPEQAGELRPVAPDSPQPPIAEDIQPQDLGEEQLHAQGQILRSSQLTGMVVWDAEHQKLGTIKEVLIDLSADCPMLFFAMAPEVAIGEGLVLVPVNVLQFQHDAQRRADFFVLSMRMDLLRNAPRIQGNNWDVIRDRQFLTKARQFYGRVERTAARPTDGEPAEQKGGLQYQQSPQQQSPPKQSPPQKKRPPQKRPPQKYPPQQFPPQQNEEPPPSPPPPIEPAPGGPGGGEPEPGGPVPGSGF